MRNTNAPACYCGLSMFLDEDEYLCPARFDGTHNAERAERHAKLHKTAVANGKLGGLARAEALTPERTQEIARQAAKARWRASRDEVQK